MILLTYLAYNGNVQLKLFKGGFKNVGRGLRVI